MIRLGRISYVNMAPVFYRLDHEVEEIGARSHSPARRARLRSVGTPGTSSNGASTR